MRSPDAEGTNAVDESERTEADRRMTAVLGCLLEPNEAAVRVGPFPTARTRTPYAVVPGTRGGVLVPVHPAACADAGIAGHSAASGARGRWGVRALAMLARTGATRFAPTQYLLGDPQHTLLGHVEGIFGQALHAAVHLGPPRANRKPVLRLMDRRGSTLAFVKIGVDALTDARVRTEIHALEHLADNRPTGLTIPTLIASGTWQGHSYAVLEPVPTGSGPTKVPTGAARHIADSMPARRSDPVRERWWSDATEVLHTGTGSATEARLRRASDALTVSVPEEGVPVGPTHGDFTPWNCFAGPRGVSVWDWERFATDRPLGWDALHYAVSLALRHRSRHTGLDTVRRRAADLTEASGGARESGRWVLAAYLWYRGVCAVRDGQLAAGSRGGALHEWLLPELESLLSRELAARP